MKRLIIAVLPMIASAMTPVPAVAATLSGLEGLGRPVADDQLASMRGKFISPSGISYFGILMSSSWQGSDGITTAATLLFSLNLTSGGAKGPTPELLVSWSRNCPTCGDSSMDVSGSGPSPTGNYVVQNSIPVGALNNVSGAVQSQQIAGSDNQAHNNMSIAIVPASSINPNTSGMTVLPQGGGEAHKFSNGDTLNFTYSANQLGLSMTNQNGALEQGVNGSIGQVTQHLLISGVDNLVNNNMQLMIGINPAAQAQQLNVQNALTVMKGAGY